MLKIIESFFKNAKIPPSSSPADLGLGFQDVEIESSGRILKAWKMSAGGNWAVLVHGWGANREVFLPLIRELYPEFSLLAFDASNHGESSPYWPVSIKVFWQDIGAAIEFLGEEVFLVGHSMGAASSIIAASTYGQVKKVVALAPFASTLEITEKMIKALPPSLRKKVLRKIEEEVGFSLEEFSPLNFICKRSIPHLLIHGKLDETVPYEDSLRLSQRCPEAELLLYPEDDHRSILSNKEILWKVRDFLTT